MIRPIVPLLLIFTFSLNGCGCVQQPNLGAPPPLHLLEYHYPFGYFQARYSDDPWIEDVNFTRPQYSPVIWIGDQPLLLGKETRQSLEHKFGEKFKKSQVGTSYDLSDVTGYICSIEFNDDGTPKEVTLHRYLAKEPKLSLSVDSPVLSLPCTPAELEHCFGKPVQITEFPDRGRAP